MNVAVFKVRKVLLLAGMIAIFAGIVALIACVLHQRTFGKPPQVLSGAFFSRPDAWTSQGGTWAADATEIRNNSEERGAKLIARAGVWKDFQIDVDIQIAEPFSEAGVVMRSSGEEEGVDAYHGYFAAIRATDSSVELGRADFGWRSMGHVTFMTEADLRGWFHLHAIAVGCRLALEVRPPNGEPVSLVADDEDCIRSGSFGLRSSLTSAKWKNLRVSPATEVDLDTIEGNSRRGIVTHDLLLSEPSNPMSVERYTASVRSEAAKREIQQGVTPISYFRYSPGSHPNVILQGAVISLPPLLDIQDNTGTIIIPNVDPRTLLKIGDVVEARGTLVSERFRSRFVDAKIRVLWSDLPYPPLAVTAEQLTAGTYRGRLIEVEGTLISTHQLEHGCELVLKDGDQIFKALGSSDFQFDPEALKPGSRLRLRGNATSLEQFTGGVYPFTVITDRIDIVSAPPWWSPIHVLWLAVACLILFGLVQWGFHEVRAWHVRLLLKEREELAFEMHDSLAQSFTGISYQLQAATMETRGEGEVQTHIQNALKMVDVSHREASRTIAALRPQYREASDIVVALKELAERLSDGGDLTVKTQVDGKNSGLPLVITDALFRIGQEAVTNAVQHANCKNLEITLQLSRNMARFTVRDDGSGIPGEGQSNGLGISGMRNRSAKVGARFSITTEPSGGTCMTVTAPLRPARGLVSAVHSVLMSPFAGGHRH